MNAKIKNIIVNYLCMFSLSFWFMVAFCAITDTLIFKHRTLKSFGIMVLAVIIVSVIALLIYINTKSYKARVGIIAEYYEKGYTPTLRDLVTTEINRIYEEGNLNVKIDWYNLLICILTEYYTINGDIENAYMTINKINRKFIYDTGMLNHQKAFFSHYASRAELYEITNNIQGMLSVIDETKIAIDKWYHKNKATDICIDYIISTYMMMVGNYDKAIEYANHSMKKGKIGKESAFIILGRLYRRMGNYAEAEKNFNMCCSITKCASVKQSALWEMTRTKQN